MKIFWIDEELELPMNKVYINHLRKQKEVQLHTCKSYVSAMKKFIDESFDLVIVDLRILKEDDDLMSDAYEQYGHIIICELLQNPLKYHFIDRDEIFKKVIILSNETNRMNEYLNKYSLDDIDYNSIFFVAKNHWAKGKEYFVKKVLDYAKNL